MRYADASGCGGDALRSNGFTPLATPSKYMASAAAVRFDEDMR
jgi:hypothetical protein